MSWTMLAPWMLGGIAFVALPILIHLISRKKARPLSFAAIAFVLQSQKKTARSMRFKELLLLLLRCLWVLCLALAFLQPALEEAKDQEQNTDEPKIVVIVLDQSASMQAVVNGETRFSRALLKAQQDIRDSEADVQWGVVGCNLDMSAAQLIPTFDRDKVFQALNSLSVTSMSSRLPPCIDAAQNILADKKEQVVRKIWVLSDMAKHAFEGSVAPASGKVQIHFEKVDEERLSNWFVSDVVMTPQRNDAKPVTQLQVQVQQVGMDKDAETLLDIFQDNKNVARQTVLFSPEMSVHSKDVHIPHVVSEASDDERQEPPVLRARLGDDAFLADNEVSLTAQTVRPIRILLVDGAPHSVPYRDEVYYLANALQKKSKRASRFQVQVVLSEDLTLAHLAQANVVYLCNVQKFSQPVTQALVQFVQTGGGLFVAMGDQIDVAWANQHLSALLPGQLRGVKKHQLLDDQSKSMGLGLARFDAKHPLFEGLVESEEKERVVGLTRVQTHTLMLLEPDANKDRDILSYFTDDTPALVEKQLGEGRILFWASSLDRDWSDLAIRPGFVPLMNQVILYLTGQLAHPRDWLHEAGQGHVVLPPRGVVEIKVRSPLGEVLVAELKDAQWKGEGFVNVEALGNKPSHLVFKKTHETGLYQVSMRRTGGEFRVYPTESFSIKIPMLESNLSSADPMSLEAAVPLGAQFFTKIQRVAQTPLWRYFLLLACVLMVLESLLLKKWWTRKN